MSAGLLQTPESQLDSLSQFDFDHRLADSTGAALVIFTSPDRGSCRKLRQVMQRVKTAQPGWQLFGVEAQRDLALTCEFEVFHLQAVFLFLGGQFQCQLKTEAHRGAVTSAVLDALQQAAREAP
ncbi:MAG: thioredoxin [Sedimenticolaceae bacterium]